MRVILSSLLVLLSLGASYSQSSLWMSPAVGLCLDGRGPMGHADISLSYLHYNRFGVTGSLFANGRSQTEGNADKAVKSYTGGGLYLLYNFFPFDEGNSKLLGRAGLVYGSGYYFKKITPVTTTYQNIYEEISYKTPGVELSVEFLFNHREGRAWSFQFFGMLHNHPFAGVNLRYSFGMFNNQL
jgi:hypothetical protein